ncbi:MAG: hypothetical protein ACM31C_16675 [Acidobacteriota bacterium]
MRGALLAMAIAGCTGRVAGGKHPTPTLPTGPCAVEGVTGMLPGVTLAIRSASCVYSVGDQAQFTYEVTTDASVPAITTPDGGGGCGSCQVRSTDPLSWVTWRIGGAAPDGTSQDYCICDTGCCPPDRMQTIQPVTAMETATIGWDLRNWNGPSDTSNPEGPYFPPGVYAVNVTFGGFASGSVTASLPVEILE